MEQESNEFSVDLKYLRKDGDKKLEEFAVREELSVDDIIDIIYKEAERIGEKNEVKVTFQIVEDDSFRVIVKPLDRMYKGTVIYPFVKILSEEKEIMLDDILGRVTLYNKKETNLTVTIDGVALDLFAMTYTKARDILINISNRKGDNGYIENENSICIKVYGVRLNRKENTDEIKSIDVYDEDAFYEEFKFAQEEKDKYDVDITNIEVPKLEEIVEPKEEEEKDDIDIVIEIPQEEIVEDKEKLLEDKLNERLRNFSLVPDEVVEDKKDTNTENDLSSIRLSKDVEELISLYEKQKEQQQILETRISNKLEELKKTSLEYNTKSVDTVDSVDNTKKNFKKYIIEGYKGLKEQGNTELAIFIGQDKEEIRNYFKFVPNGQSLEQEYEIYEDNMYINYDENNKCTGIGFYNEDVEDKNEFYLFGKNLATMKYKDIVQLIKDHDYKALEYDDGIVSLEYGVAIDPKEEGDYKNSTCEVIHLFEKGVYNDLK